MLQIGSRTRVYVYHGESDMRWSFERLSAIVKQEMEKDSLSGDLYIFVSGRRDRMKILYFESNGYALWYKRLERGTFSALSVGEISRAELECLLEGVEIDKKRQKKRYFHSFDDAQRVVI